MAPHAPTLVFVMLLAGAAFLLLLLVALQPPPAKERLRFTLASLFVITTAASAIMASVVGAPWIIAGVALLVITGFLALSELPKAGHRSHRSRVLFSSELHGDQDRLPKYITKRLTDDILVLLVGLSALAIAAWVLL